MDTRDEVQAYADGRLDEGRRAAVEAWLETQPDEAESIAVYRRVREALRLAYDAILDEPVPPALTRFRARQRRAWFAAAAAGVIVALGAIPVLHDGSVRTLTRSAASAHATYAQDVRHAVELEANREAQLVAWLSSRLGMKVSAPKLEEAGAKLVGGRLLPGERSPAAWLMYETADGGRIGLYWMPESKSRIDTGLRFAREGTVDMFYWIDAECGYAVSSSDLPRERLEHLAMLAYEQLEK